MTTSSASRGRSGGGRDDCRPTRRALLEVARESCRLGRVVRAEVLGPAETDRLVEQPHVDARAANRTRQLEPIAHPVAARAEIGIAYRIALHADLGVGRRLVEAARQQAVVF